MNKPSLENNIEYEVIDLWANFVSILAYWRVILVGGIIGLLLGAGAYKSSNYEVKTTIINNGGSDFITWRNLKGNLPILASKLLQSKKITNSKEEIEMKKLISQDWWNAHFVPTFAVSKSDAKDMLPQSTDLKELGATKILNFIVTSSGKTQNEAIEGAQIGATFFLRGASYFALRALVNSYDTISINNAAQLQKSISNAKVALIDLSVRESNLRKLAEKHKEQPANSLVQMLTAAYNNNPAGLVKFLPISNQLVAVESEINQQNEVLENARGLFAENRFLQTFVGLALPVIDNHLDGIKSAQELLRILQEQRNKIDLQDLNTLKQLDSINADITGILTTHQKGFFINSSSDARRSAKLIKLLIGGFILGGFLAFIGALLHRSYSHHKACHRVSS